jgi:glycosyltransferase involved in cell wall biosynthesis
VITVIFASFNGEDTLPIMLDAFVDINPPEGGWNIVAVDNASTDRTKEIIISYSDILPINYLYQSKQGKSHALNMGMAHANGDLIVFTDDDVIPDRYWLTKLYECALNNPGHHVFFGKIDPYWLVPPSQWLLDNVPLNICYGKLDHIDGVCGPEYSGGANFAITRRVLEKDFRFDSKYGPDGNKYSMGEDSNFIYTLYENGFIPYFCSNACVKHIVNSQQYNLTWIFTRARRYGESSCNKKLRFSRFPEDKSFPFWMIRIMINNIFLYVFYKIKNSRNDLFKLSWDNNYYYGYLKQYINSSIK